MRIETERLRLREWQTGEEDELARFLGNDQVMYAYEGAFDDEKIADWLQWNLRSYREKGFGLWAIERRSDGLLIGECGLIELTVEDKHYVEIGYHLIPEAWHQGYAIEAAQAVKAYAFETLALPEVVSSVRDTNLASMNVAIRNGMVVRKRWLKQYKGIDMPHYLFSVKHSI